MIIPTGGIKPRMEVKMNEMFKLLPISLNLFEGGGDGGAASGGDGAGASENANATVIYGKQDGDGPVTPDAGEIDEAAVTSDAREAKRKAYKDLINGEYKEFYTEDTQRMINRRFKGMKAMEDQLNKQSSILSMLSARYNLEDGDYDGITKALENDTQYWEAAADAAGMEPEQYRQWLQITRENKALKAAQKYRENQAAVQQQLSKWYSDAEAFKSEVPSFNLDAESQNPQFLSLLKAGIPIKTAYQVIHMDDIVTEKMSSAAKKAAKNTAESIRANGTRPSENGTSSQSAFVIKNDPSKWTKADRSEVVRRAARGEKIRL